MLIALTYWRSSLLNEEPLLGKNDWIVQKDNTAIHNVRKNKIRFHGE